MHMYGIFNLMGYGIFRIVRESVKVLEVNSK